MGVRFTLPPARFLASALGLPRSFIKFSRVPFLVSARVSWRTYRRFGPVRFLVNAQGWSRLGFLFLHRRFP